MPSAWLASATLPLWRRSMSWERTLEQLGANESIPVDCRMIAASKADLVALAAEGGFRADLLYRLYVAQIGLPPLSERREDVPLLLEHFVWRRHVASQQPTPVVSASQVSELTERALRVDLFALRVTRPCVAAAQPCVPAAVGRAAQPSHQGSPMPLQTGCRSVRALATRGHQVDSRSKGCKACCPHRSGQPSLEGGLGEKGQRGALELPSWVGLLLHTKRREPVVAETASPWPLFPRVLPIEALRST
ncbi:two component, sigma54 specific, Fis family transcriptional regulator [Pandoraea terrigena]|uniref:Two component, sigma54 specific, Fis family transcriptional regulator n=1 Tax=Pandoraea terrigena TaxID=2508292 RepID=A0A5E4VB40_9BURK|nr:two component, sigma54 specific, Fis family transcriptional regulator [Pandoraea terrigena]